MKIRTPILKVGKHGLTYGLGNIISKSTIFFLIPVYTKYLTTHEVGILALIEMTEMFFLAIGSSSVYQSIWYKLSSKSEVSNSKIIFSGFSGLIIFNMIFLAILSLFADSLYQFFGLTDQNYSILVYLVLLNILLQFGGTFTLALWQYQQKSIPFISLSIVQLIGILGFSIYFVIFQGLGLMGVILGKLIVVSVIFVFCTFLILKEYLCVPSFKVFFELIKFGYPLIFIGLATPILSVSDRYFLNLFVPLSMIGIYSINYKFGMLINMLLVTPFQRSILPMVYRNGLDQKSAPIYCDLYFYFNVVGCFILLCVSFFIHPIIEWVSNPEYLRGTYIVPIVACAYLISGARSFFIPFVAIKNRTNMLGKISIVGIIICLLLNYYFIKYYGIKGAALATLFSYIILSYSLYLLSRKFNPMNWNWPRIAKLYFVTMVTFFSVKYCAVFWNIHYPILGLIGIVVFPILIYVLKIIGKREISGLKDLISIFRK